MRVTVTFDDGSKLSNALGLRDFGAGSFGSSYNTYLLDVNKLASVGKTLSDVADVRPDAQVSHNLSWADLGFKLDAPVVEPEPPVEPEQPEEPQPPVEPEQPEEPQAPAEPEQPQEPAAIEIFGTDARDTLKGTMADEIIIGGDGNDRLLGGGGSDTFVFGADANNGSRNWDVIRDFDLADDTILLKDGAQIRRIIERNDKVIIQL